MIRILSRQDVQRAVTMVEAIDTVQAAYIHLSQGEATVPVRRRPVHASLPIAFGWLGCQSRYHLPP